MNIFYLDKNPELCAEYHGDKHIVKMILETAQLLSTAHHLLPREDFPKGIYRKTHQNHPCALWVRISPCNYWWTWRLLCELCKEFEFRRGKKHKTENLIKELKKIPNIPFLKVYTKPALCMPDKFKVKCPVQSYRNYYRYKYQLRIAEYNWGRQKPFWLN